MATAAPGPCGTQPRMMFRRPQPEHGSYPPRLRSGMEVLAPTRCQWTETIWGSRNKASTSPGSNSRARVRQGILSRA